MPSAAIVRGDRGIPGWAATDRWLGAIGR